MSSLNNTYIENSKIDIEFVKMHGIANDYVYVYDNGNNLPSDLSRLSIAISNRHCGIGGDGLVIISKSEREDADFRMRIFNADGSEAQMCGNASRCVGKLLYDRGYTESKQIRLETMAGIKVLSLFLNDLDKVESVDVDMGEPIFTPEDIPVNEAECLTGCDSELYFKSICVNGKTLCFYLVSMGNPHAICFLDGDITDEYVLGAGPYIEKYPSWPERTNVEFARIIGPNIIEMRVWERGSGETMACGTGACAVAVAAISLGLAKSPVEIKLTGGNLKIKWERRTSHVIMTGPATLVADGIYHYDSECDNIWMHPRQ